MINQNVRLPLKRVLNRLKKEELSKVINDWGFVTEVNFDCSKKSVVDQILEACQKRKVKPKNIFELHLISAISHPTSKKWTVYHLTKSPETSDKEITNGHDIYLKLKKQLSYFFKHYLCFRKHGDSLWFHVAIQDSPHPHACFLPSNQFLIVHYPHSPYVMVTNIKVAYKDFIMQALMNSLECTEIRQLQLTGQSLYSLSDMVLNRKSQGGFGRYRLDEVHHNPLSMKTRKRTIPDSKDDEFDSRIFCENINKKKRRKEINISTFGTHDQPVLETIKYSLETKFRGMEFAPAMVAQKKPFHFKVKFEGSNVLEGIKQLGPAGLATLPLPHHLGGVHSLAKNYFVLADKKKDQNIL